MFSTTRAGLIILGLTHEKTAPKAALEEYLHMVRGGRSLGTRFIVEELPKTVSREHLHVVFGGWSYGTRVMLNVELLFNIMGFRSRSMLACDERGGMPRTLHHIRLNCVDPNHACV